MKHLLLCTLVAGIGFASRVAMADAMTVGDLQDICTGSDQVSVSACRFYILGVSQGIGLGISIADGKTRAGRLCLPEDTPSSALTFVVKKAIGEDLMFFPKDRDLDASGFAGAALIKTFPCK